MTYTEEIWLQIRKNGFKALVVQLRKDVRKEFVLVRNSVDPHVLQVPKDII